MPSLLLGCGNSREKKVRRLSDDEGWTGDLVTMDMNPNCGADIVWDLENRPFPFEDNTFDEMGAYDVLEHIGKQGDWKGFFEEFAEYWRILKPGGTFGILVPVNADALADIGHVRFFSPMYFRFLDQQWYGQQLAEGRPVTDYRWFWKCDFETVAVKEVGENPEQPHHVVAILRKR